MLSELYSWSAVAGVLRKLEFITLIFNDVKVKGRTVVIV